jgi:hypothetical protein
MEMTGANVVAVPVDPRLCEQIGGKIQNWEKR